MLISNGGYISRQSMLLVRARSVCDLSCYPLFFYTVVPFVWVICYVFHFFLCCCVLCFVLSPFFFLPCRFLAEYAILSVAAFATSVHLILHIIDSRMTGAWHGKATAILLLEFFSEVGFFFSPKPYLWPASLAERNAVVPGKIRENSMTIDQRPEDNYHVYQLERVFTLFGSVGPNETDRGCWRLFVPFLCKKKV